MDSALSGVLHESSVELAPKVLRTLKKPKSSYINAEVMELVEELRGEKASDKFDETSETFKSKIGRRVIDFEVSHFLLDVCNFA